MRKVAPVNYLNIALMAICVPLAYLFPFELFLVSYAILGPIHYLTEIAWLNKRHYFTTGPRDYLLLLVICLVMLILYLTDVAYHYHWTNGNFMSPFGVDGSMFSPWLRMWISALIIMAFVAGFATVLFKNGIDKLIFTFIATGLLLLMGFLRPYLLILALLLPTLIHTTLFMVAFILSGAMRSRSFSGYLSVAVFILCSVIFFVYTPGWVNYHAHSFVIDRFLQGDFSSLNKLFTGSNSISDALFSPTGLKVQRFIAFAYTYHYLNWFSKTKVIDWNNVTPAWRWFSIIASVALIALYLINFKAGLVAIFFVSMLHVFLEFPLNYRTFQGIGAGIVDIVKKTRSAGT